MKFLKRSKLLREFFRETLFAQILLAAIFIFALFFYTWSFDTLFGPKPSQDNFALIFFEFDYGRRVFEGEVVPGMTMIEAVNAAASAGAINFNFVIEDNKTKIKSLNGYTESEHKFVFYLNSRPIEQEQLLEVPIKPGDRVAVYFE